MLKVYFAGPDIFYPDYEKRKEKIRDLCIKSDIEPLFPSDYGQTDPEMIFLGNLVLIRKADAIIANLNPFRSEIEPDSGTVLECGLAYGMGKPDIVRIGYVSDQRSQIEKLGTDVCSDGSLVENFNLPVNLMLAHCLNKIVGSLEEAILLLHKIPRFAQIFEQS